MYTDEKREQIRNEFTELCYDIYDKTFPLLQNKPYLIALNSLSASFMLTLITILNAENLTEEEYLETFNKTIRRVEENFKHVTKNNIKKQKEFN